MEKYMNDIPFELAYRAHAATSFDPEKRAKQEQEGHARYLAELVDKYGHLAGAPEEIENFRTGYLKKKFAHLQARTRIMSPMIVGQLLGIKRLAMFNINGLKNLLSGETKQLFG